MWREVNPVWGVHSVIHHDNRTPVKGGKKARKERRQVGIEREGVSDFIPSFLKQKSWGAHYKLFFFHSGACLTLIGCCVCCSRKERIRELWENSIRKQSLHRLHRHGWVLLSYSFTIPETSELKRNVRSLLGKLPPPHQKQRKRVDSPFFCPMRILFSLKPSQSPTISLSLLYDLLNHKIVRVSGQVHTNTTVFSSPER